MCDHLLITANAVMNPYCMSPSLDPAGLLADSLVVGVEVGQKRQSTQHAW